MGAAQPRSDGRGVADGTDGTAKYRVLRSNRAYTKGLTYHGGIVAGVRHGKGVEIDSEGGVFSVVYERGVLVTRAYALRGRVLTLGQPGTCTSAAGHKNV